jgi:hypothetical protein
LLLFPQQCTAALLVSYHRKTQPASAGATALKKAWKKPEKTLKKVVNDLTIPG